jgi:hypothetical protein
MPNSRIAIPYTPAFDNRDKESSPLAAATFFWVHMERSSAARKMIG